jgi:RHS repeat-associated protein
MERTAMRLVVSVLVFSFLLPAAPAAAPVPGSDPRMPLAEAAAHASEVAWKLPAPLLPRVAPQRVPIDEGSAATTPTPAANSSTLAITTTALITLTGSGFTPAVLTVTVDSAVVWVNATTQTHVLQSGAPDQIFVPCLLAGAARTSGLDIPGWTANPLADAHNASFSATLPPGGSCAYTFASTGEFPYFAATAPEFAGRVVVEPGPPPQPDFALDAWPGAQSVAPGRALSYTVALTAVNGLTRSVALEVAGYPANASASWGTNPVTPTVQTSLVVTSSPSTPAGAYRLAISGTAGSLSHTTEVTMTVLSVAASRVISLTDSGFAPAVLAVTAGTAVVWVNATGQTHVLQSGTPGQGQLVGSRGVSSLSESFSATLAPGATFTHTFASVGDFPYFAATAPQFKGWVMAQPGPLHPDFVLDSWPVTATVPAGQAIAYTVAVLATADMTRSVALNVAGYPAGALIAWTVNPVTPTAQTSLVVTSSPSTPAGAYRLAINGSAGSLSHIAQVTMTVLALTPSPVISLTDSGFTPTVLAVTAGTAVVWYNATGQTHVLQSGAPGQVQLMYGRGLYRVYLPYVREGFSGVSSLSESFSATLAPGATFTHTFASVGDFPYLAATAPQFKGWVIVQPGPLHPDFVLDSWPVTGTVLAGQAISYTVAVLATAEMTRAVALEVGGYPPGALIGWTVNPVTPTAQTAVFITPSPAAPTGTYTLAFTGTAGGWVHTAGATMTVVKESTPPEPVATPLDLTVATDFAAATSFLYSGSGAIQVGVSPGTMQANRVAVLRGRVFDCNGAPLPGVRITVLGHPEYGWTLTRTDGMFDLAVNGGGPLTVNYQKAGYLPAQRQLSTPWQDYVWAPDVVLIQLDIQVTTIDLTLPITTMQVAQASVISDAAGQRQQTVLFPPAVQASMTLPNGITQALTAMHVRATEYTVGGSGPQAMPAELPPNTGYTYAVEFSADEAGAANALDVQFSQPLIAYVENFLSAGVGWTVPTGYYDRARGTWVPSDNGRVVKIVRIVGGLADLDTDGDGQPDNGAVVTPTMVLSISAAERQQLAALYLAGQSLWRVPIRHFCAWDHNWPFGPPPDATFPDQGPPTQDSPVDDPCNSPGSTIECQNQVLGEARRVGGTPFNLHYQSDRVPGRKAAYTLDIPLSGANVPASLVSIQVEIDVAGQHHTHSVARDHPCLHQQQLLGPASVSTSSVLGDVDLSQQRYSFTWDGQDAYGRTLQGPQPATVRIGYTYCGVYQKADRFGYNGNGRIEGSRTRQEVTLWQTWQTRIGTWDARPQGLGGWTLDVHNAYDPVARVLYLGDGGRRAAQNLDRVISTVAGNGVYDPSGSGSGDGGPATKAQVIPYGIAVGPDGSLYLTQGYPSNSIRKVSPNGIITTIVAIPGVWLGNHIALGPDGSLYFETDDAQNAGNQVLRLSPDGVITPVAGVPNYHGGFGGDGGPATAAYLDSPRGLAVAPDGSVYIGDVQNYRIRKVSPDGLITTVVHFSFSYGPSVVALGPDGSLYFDDTPYHTYIRRLSPDGSITTVADIMSYGKHLEVNSDGSLYVTGSYYEAVRRINPDGTVINAAGTGVRGYSGDLGPATAAQLSMPFGFAVAPDGGLYIADSGNSRIRKVAPPLPGASDSDIVIASEDGSQVHIFNYAGRHLRTLDALTGAALYQFGYDGAGRLASITDGDGNVTRVERDAGGHLTAIVAPFGQRTALSLNADGYLASVTDPAGQTTLLSYNGDGLLTTLTDPRGGIHQFAYDSLGRLARDQDPAGGAQTLGRTTIAGSFSVTRTTAMSRSTVYRVDDLATGAERLVNTFPGGSQSQTQLNTDASYTLTLANGMVAMGVEGPDPRWGMAAPLYKSTGVRTPGGLTTNLAIQRTVTLADPANPLSLQSLTDQLTVNGRTYTSVYNAAARTFTDNTPQGRQGTTTVDAQGRVVWEQTAGLLPTAYGYDGRGRLISATLGTGPEARPIGLAYNGQGYLASLTDPLGRVVRFEYDEAGRVITQTLADSSKILYAYDANDNLTSLTPPGRPAHRFSYTPVDRAETYEPPDVGAGSTQTAYTYNLDRQLTRITRPDGQLVELGYDSAGRLSSLTTPRGMLSYSYHPTTGQLAGITAPGGITLSYRYDGDLATSVAWSGPISGSVGYTYDNDFRLTTQSINGGMAIAYQYDNDSLLTQAGSLALSRSPQNGLLQGTTLGNVADTWSYDGIGEPASYRATYSGAQVFKEDYSYDNLGRILTKSETISGTTDVYGYRYDLAGRLAGVTRNGVTVATYTYDGNGNRLSTTGPGGTLSGAYDDQDRLLEYGTTTYTYTANGELLSKTANGQTTTYNYDVLGNLTSVSLPDGTLIEYLVDGQNRRIGKKVNGSLVQGFLYQGQLSPIAELDGSGNLVARFVYGTRANVPDYMVKGGNTYRILTDHLGSPRLVVNIADGSVAQRLDYDEFGNVISDTNPGFQALGFAGGLYDRHTGLTRFGARDYEAQTGRWTAKDPVGFEAGDTNFYAYVWNDPVNLIDPSGHSWFYPVRWLICMYELYKWDRNCTASKPTCLKTINSCDEEASLRCLQERQDWLAQCFGAARGSFFQSCLKASTDYAPTGKVPLRDLKPAIEW